MNKDAQPAPTYAPMVVRDGVRILPVFRGYTVDVRLHEFRKVPPDHGRPIAFLPFASPEGDVLLADYIAVASPDDLAYLYEHWQP